MKKITALGIGIMIGAVGPKVVDDTLHKYVYTTKNLGRLIGFQARIDSYSEEIEDVCKVQREINDYLAYHPTCMYLTSDDVFSLIESVTKRHIRRSKTGRFVLAWDRDTLRNLEVHTLHGGYYLAFPSPQMGLLKPKEREETYSENDIRNMIRAVYGEEED